MSASPRAVARAERVVLVAACRFPAPRGSQVLIDQMAQSFHRRGVETHLVAPLARGFSRPYATHALAPRSGRTPSADPTAGFALGRVAFDAALVAHLDAVVRRVRPGVVHAHNYEGLVAALLVRRLRGVPVVFHSHSVLVDELPQYARPGPRARAAARRVGEWCDRHLPRLADHVVALSEDVAAYLRAAGVSAERLSVIAPGMDAAAAFVAPERAGARQAVFAGNLDGYQDLDFLLDGWELAGPAAGAGLTLVTHAPARDLIAEVERRRLGASVRVVRAASFGDVARELGGASVGLSPRRSWSGFPIKTLNYMASALPTIAHAGSAKGVRDGETGWVVGDGGPGALADALRAALGDPEECRRRGLAARENLEEQHAWSRLAPALLEVSRRVAARGS